MSLTPSFLLPLFLLVLCASGVFSLPLPTFIEPEALDGLRSSKKMSEFIKHLGIPHEGLCHPGTDENMEPMFNEDLAFGDLIMEEEEAEDKERAEEDTNNVENDLTSGGASPTRNRKMSEKKPKKWPDGIIPYYISKDFNTDEKEKIENAIEDMNDSLQSVYFRPVRKNDRNYVIIYSGKGCYARLGMKGGQQPVSLQADKCLIRGTIQHELLHVLGFRHEQNRPDRDDYIEIIYKNIPEVWHKDYKRYKVSQANFVGDYDYYSVLHYPPEAPRSQGRKYAFKILDDSVDIRKIGERERMSEMDTQKAEELYSDDTEKNEDR